MTITYQSILRNGIPSQEIIPRPLAGIARDEGEQPPSVVQHVAVVCALRVGYHIGMGVLGHAVDIVYPLLLVVDLLDEDLVPVDEAVVEDQRGLVGREGELGG